MLQMRTIGKYDLELSKSEYEKAKAELLIAELNLKRCKISAPFMELLNKFRQYI